MSEHLTRDAFAKRLNSKFNIHFAADEMIEAELTEVSELKSRPPQESFSVIFVAPIEIPFEQKIYEIEHSDFGSFELFLVPVGKRDIGIEYESVFNRLID